MGKIKLVYVYGIQYSIPKISVQWTVDIWNYYISYHIIYKF